ncbi:uncharacterized protein BXZ73DRAFT_80634 [Epithele typhae]|uniref:uncharacterized protein n=1 Tax=Epithele typhae TaxID=378194 RepID=UPI002007F07C|nr:uncharacterized protein BXZ73DRAFT_80634 [Epithele typhae]KAH9918411.1 hypothetical protein BXZ73DRAFT_80634 [Epithele typhae]
MQSDNPPANASIVRDFEAAYHAIRGSLGLQDLKGIEQALRVTAASILEDLRARINSYSPFSRIPAEIISEIFLHSVYRPDRRASSQIWQEQAEHIATLLPLTHVCQSWRRVALQLPALWTDIDCHSRGQYLAFKERSRELGVSLVVNYRDVSRICRPRFALGNAARISNMAIEEVVSSLIHRIQRLDIELECPELEPPPWLFTTSAPRMECLNLVIECSDSYSLDSGWPGTPPEKSLLFRDQISSLRALSLSGLFKWIPVNSFPDLTHFSLSCENCHMAMVLDVVLAATPRLEILHLSRASVTTATLFPSSRPRLPFLRSVSFSESFPSALQIVYFVDIPASTPIRMVTSSIDPHSVLDLKDVPAVRDATDLTVRVSRPLEDVEFILEGACGFLLQGQTEDATENAHVWTHTQLGRLHDAPLSGLVNFLLDVPFVDVQTPIALLHHMPRLDTLRIRLSSPPPFGTLADDIDIDVQDLASPVEKLRALGRALVGAGDDGLTWAPLCPVLTSLTVGSNLDPEGSEFSGALATFADALAELLDGRARAGCPLEALTVQPVRHASEPEDDEVERELGAPWERLVALTRRFEQLEVVPPGTELLEKPCLAGFWDVEDMRRVAHKHIPVDSPVDVWPPNKIRPCRVQTSPPLRLKCTPPRESDHTTIAPSTTEGSLPPNGPDSVSPVAVSTTQNCGAAPAGGLQSEGPVAGSWTKHSARVPSADKALGVSPCSGDSAIGDAGVEDLIHHEGTASRQCEHSEVAALGAASKNGLIHIFFRVATVPAVDQTGVNFS